MDNLNNKKVKINTDKILSRETDYNPRYVQFLHDNVDTVFTVALEESYTEMYTFVEDNTWLFHKDDLIEVN